MGRIDRSEGQDSVMKRRHINAMLHNIEEYELVKNKKHNLFITLEDFYRAKGLCRQNFLKYYRRFLLSNRDIESLIPKKIGRKFKDELEYLPEIIDKIKSIRQRGYNRFEISRQLKKNDNIAISPSSAYRLMRNTISNLKSKIYQNIFVIKKAKNASCIPIQLKAFCLF